jgi:hypothetical protein
MARCGHFIEHVEGASMEVVGVATLEPKTDSAASWMCSLVEVERVELRLGELEYGDGDTVEDRLDVEHGSICEVVRVIGRRVADGELERSERSIVGGGCCVVDRLGVEHGQVIEAVGVEDGELSVVLQLDELEHGDSDVVGTEHRSLVEVFELGEVLVGSTLRGEGDGFRSLRLHPIENLSHSIRLKMSPKVDSILGLGLGWEKITRIEWASLPIISNPGRIVQIIGYQE